MTASGTLDLYFKILNLGLETEKADENLLIGFRHLKTDISNQEWEDIYNWGVQQGVAAIQFSGLQQLTDVKIDLPFQLPERKLKMKWFAHAMQVENHCKSQFKIASELAEIYAENGIRTVVLKGIAVARNYPQPNYRPCGDLDCFLLGDYEQGNVIAENAGAKVVRDFYKHSHISYKGLIVENHQFCTAIRGSEKTKAFERLLQSILQQEGSTMVGETKLECPSPMFNALFLTHHAQRHFLSEGIALRHLCDWAMLLHKHSDKIDWVKFKSYCDEFGLSYFAESMTRLSEKYLMVNIPASYNISSDEERDCYLFDEIMNGISHNLSFDSIWKHRFDIVKSKFNTRKRYDMFSDTSFIQNILQLVYGFCFDANPKI